MKEDAIALLQHVRAGLCGRTACRTSEPAQTSGEGSQHGMRHAARPPAEDLVLDVECIEQIGMSGDRIRKA